MASGNEPGLLRIVVEDAGGNQYIAHTIRSDSAVNAGKSPDGVLANLTIDKQVKLGLAGPIAKGGSRIRLLFKFDSTDGLDVSDGVYQVAVTEVLPDGRAIAERNLSASDLGIATDIPAATPAGSWIELGTGFQIPQGQYFRVGSASLSTPTVLSVEDDTA